jgi:hypothetical protein
MSYELIAILTVGVVLGLGQIATMIYAIQGFKEMHGVQRALGGLVIQESERLQTLLRSTS